MFDLFHYKKDGKITEWALGLPAAIVIVVAIVLLAGGKDVLASVLSSLHFP
jgi:hypothetical protein